MIRIDKASIEASREVWKSLAKGHGWYKEPFYICIWVNKRGQVEDTLCTTLILEKATEDLIKSSESDSYLKPKDYEIVENDKVS